MPFSDRPRLAQLYVASICVLAAVLGALAAWHPSNGAPAQLFALLIAATTFAHSFPVSTPDKQSYHVSLPFFVAAVILLSPLQLVALVGVVHLAESVRIRRSTVVQLFNAATYALTGLVAQAVYRVLWPGQADLMTDLSQPTCLAAGLAAAATFVILNRGLVSFAIWSAHGISIRKQHMFELEGLLTDGILLLMGVPLAHLVWIAPWAAAVGAAPLWLIHRVLDLPNIRAKDRQDGLTELFTAPYLTETCTRELNRGRRFNRPVSLLLLDVDRLGELNALHGQQTGDAVLRATAQTIVGSLREYDLPARLAGGLFAVLLPETDLAQAQIVAERIRRTTERGHEVSGSVEQVHVTLSVGAAVVDGQPATAAQLFDAAESALAIAKQDGGNRIAFQAVQTPNLAAVPAAPHVPGRAPVPLLRMTKRRRGTPGLVSTWLRRHADTVAVGSVAALGLAVCMVGAIAELDWPMLAVMLCLSALAGLAFYFKSLPLALALATELNRSPVRLLATRSCRMWPQYAAVGIGVLLSVYAYARIGLTAAIVIIAFGLLVRQLAGRYVVHMLESVRLLRSANEALEHQAFHDPLTNLPNRALFAERLEHAMVRASDGCVAVLFIDLDDFKSVNDTLGHAAGDTLLISTTERLFQCIRREDTIARLGGDEFTVLLEDMRDPSDAARMAERISQALLEPFEIQGKQVTVSSSIGIALDTDRSHRPDDLLREADLAMYRAKSGGKARYEIFDTGMAERAMERLGLETEIRHALERDEIAVEYQPVLDTPSEVVQSMAARLRWQHPRHGVLDQDEFMRLAEDTGAMTGLSAWLLTRACRDAQAWQRTSPSIGVQVGLPCGLLDRPELPGNILSALTTSGLAPHLLRFELSEELLGPDKDAYAGALERIAQLGVRFTPSAELAGAIVRLGTAVGMTIGSAEQVVPAELEPVVVGRAA